MKTVSSSKKVRTPKRTESSGRTSSSAKQKPQLSETKQAMLKKFDVSLFYTLLLELQVLPQNIQAAAAEGADFPRVHFPGAFLAIGCQCHSFLSVPVDTDIVSFPGTVFKANKTLPLPGLEETHLHKILSLFKQTFVRYCYLWSIVVKCTRHRGEYLVSPGCPE